MKHVTKKSLKFVQKLILTIRKKINEKIKQKFDFLTFFTKKTV